MFLKVLVCVALAAGAASVADAQMVRAQDPQSVVAAMHAAGYAAELGVDNIGDPKIDSNVAGSRFTIFFYNCTNNRECATVQFHSGYDLRTAITLDRINEWNRNKRFGRAFLDREGDPVLEMDVDLDDGGISALLFIDNLEFWETVLVEFEQHIGFRQ